MFSFILFILVIILMRLNCHFDFSCSKPYTGKTDTRYKDIKL
ncbi:hypothetical protein [Campylobacter hyointestinalis]|nr:hypothetical protein [Campylobacter hyointestinalis]